jgi:hypothetical protein
MKFTSAAIGFVLATLITLGARAEPPCSAMLFASAIATPSSL